MLVTDKIQMVSKGTINLATEEISLTFDTYPTKFYKANVSEVLINPFVKISGTLAKPELAFDAGQVGLAAATAGLSILAKSLIARLSAASDPCAKFLEEGE